MTSNPTRRGVCRVCGQTVPLDHDNRVASHGAGPFLECGGTGYLADERRSAAGK